MAQQKDRFAEIADEIIDLDWGCGCCGETTKPELKEQIIEILREATSAPTATEGRKTKKR